MFNEDDIFGLPSFDEKIYYDDSMPPIYDDYIDESGFGRVSTLGSSDPTILQDVESYCDEHESGFGRVSTLFSDDSTISEEVPIEYENKVAIHDTTKNYYEGVIHACRSCNNIKFPPYVLKVLKVMLVLPSYASRLLFL